ASRARRPRRGWPGPSTRASERCSSRRSSTRSSPSTGRRSDGTAPAPAAYQGHMIRGMLLVALVLALAPVARPAPPGPQRTVPCNEVIGHSRFPHVTSGYRTVLGAVSVPPAYL